MSGVLYIVATPIGNLGDISLRAIETLREVALIAAEDTRHSGLLLKHLGIETPMISCHQHNEQMRSREIIEKLESGADVALISDAGTPLISDPGYRLVEAARQRQIRVSPIPGPSSAIAALCASGLPTERFYFCGFVAAKAGEREKQLRELEAVPATLVLFESGHRILGLLGQIATLFEERRCIVAKELTKLHERFLEGSAAELKRQFEAESRLLKGEFVVLIDNTALSGERRLQGDDIELLSVLLEESNLRTAVKIAMRLTGKSKNQIYQQALKMCADDAE